MKESVYKKALGTTLASIRKKRNMSQEDLAYKADVDRSYLSELEHGKYSPSVWIIYRLCDALKIQPSDFLDQVEKTLKR